MSSSTAFPGYLIVTNEAGIAYYVFVLVYTTVAFLMIAPLASWSRKFQSKAILFADEEMGELEQQSIQQQSQHPEDKEIPGSEATGDGSRKTTSSTQHSHPSNSNSSSSVTTTATPPSQVPTNVTTKSKRSNANTNKSASSFGGRSAGTSYSGFGRLMRELDNVAAAEYPDQNPDFSRGLARSSTALRRGGASKVSAEQSSSGLSNSVATTSRLHKERSNCSHLSRKKLSMLDVSGRRWKHRRPIGRVDVIHNAIASSCGAGSSLTGTSFTAQSTGANHHNNSGGAVHHRTGLSSVASSVLEEEQRQQGWPSSQDAMMHQFANRGGMFRRSRFLRRPSHSAASERSAMSSIVDDISPNDAADANDPGRGNIFLHPEGDRRASRSPSMESDLKLGCLTSGIEHLLNLASPEAEMRRVLTSAIPLAAGAMSDALFRLVTAGFVSVYLGTQSMIAYLLVGLFVRLTSEELSGAIIDAVSSFVQIALFSGAPDAGYVAGQYVQLGVVLQMILCVPLLVVWALYMENVVLWLVSSHAIAELAENYARIVVIHYLVLALSRTCTSIFHVCGHEHFESIIDISASSIQLIVIACVVALVEDATLTTVAYIQVLIGFAAAVVKVTYPAIRGWMRPFQKGMFLNLAFVQNFSGLRQIARATIPLFLGTLLEFGEWEVLTLCMRYLGPAEVATWALLGAIWDVLEALTEGIGEASAIQVAFLLAAAQPQRAKMLSHTAIYLALIQSVLVTSALYMGGSHLAVLLSDDWTIQHLTNDSFVLIGFANFTMAFAQISWSLIGSQGRFRLATSVLFVSRWLVTIPVALVTIFAFFLDLNAVGGALVVGYATASCALTFIVLRSDWNRLSKVMQEMNNPVGDDDLAVFDEDDSSDDSDDPFGFGTAGVATGVNDGASVTPSQKSRATARSKASKRSKRSQRQSASTN